MSSVVCGSATVNCHDGEPRYVCMHTTTRAVLRLGGALATKQVRQQWSPKQPDGSCDEFGRSADGKTSRITYVAHMDFIGCGTMVVASLSITKTMFSCINQQTHLATQHCMCDDVFTSHTDVCVGW
jgi:hypothetical protein